MSNLNLLPPQWKKLTVVFLKKCCTKLACLKDSNGLVEQI